MNHVQFSLLLRALVAGIYQIEQHVPLLNRINVFPVVDADTGSNLAQTLSPLRRAIEEQNRKQPSATITLAQLEEALLTGARGNSGVILAQFLVAFFDSVFMERELTFEVLEHAVESGARQARSAIAKPVSGTILTVMDKTAQYLSENSAMSTLQQHAAMEAFSCEQVAKTRGQMPRLEKAGVVDSGALGFHILFGTLSLALPAVAGDPAAKDQIEARRKGTSSPPLGPISQSILPEFLNALETEKADYRFCINVLYDPQSIPSRERIHKELGEMASSIDFAATGDLIKLHLHSNRPQAIRRTLEKTGAILHYDVEDMTVGLARAKSPPSSAIDNHMNLRVVSDSSLSLSRDLAASHGILRMENYIHAHSQMIQDASLNREELFKRMRLGQRYKTAQTSPEEARLFFENALKISNQLLYVAVGNAYTGTQEMARQVISNLPQKERICVVDTHAASGQQGLVCLTAARQAARVDNLRELAQFAENQIETCREYLVIDDLQYLRRSGRIGRIKATFAGLFSVKPIVGHGLDGAITHDKVRSHEAAVEEIIHRVSNHPGTGDLVLLLEYTDNLDWLMTDVVPKMEISVPRKTEVVLSPLSATSSVHMGPGTWGVAVTRT